ncbi:MAG: metal-independent alpha-mannosidase [Bacillota bacterium]
MSNRIMTIPREINENQVVLSTGNHYLALPEVDVQSGSIKNLNVTSKKDKGLLEISGDNYLIKPVFFQGGKMLLPQKVFWERLYYYIPQITFVFDTFSVRARLYADLQEKGFVYEFASEKSIDVCLHINVDQVNFLRFNRYGAMGVKRLSIDKWLNNPCVLFEAYRFQMGMAFGGERGFCADFPEHFVNQAVDINKPLHLSLHIPLESQKPNAFYIALNAETDGASTTLIHLRRKGFKQIFGEWEKWLSKSIIQTSHKKIEKLFNENSLFNYFYSVSKDFYTDEWAAMTSRSPRYYVSGAFWERDSFYWSFPAIKIIDVPFHEKLVREMILLHAINPGDHAHYIDGTVLYPGFELDEACGYFNDLDFSLSFFDADILKAFEGITARIEREFDAEVGLYKTFLLPSDDPTEYPFVLFDNVLLIRGYGNLIQLYRRLGLDAALLEARVTTVKTNLNKFIRIIDGKPMYIWAFDKEQRYILYNDPPGNLGTLVYYGLPNDEIFQNTMAYYYSDRYKYYDSCARFKELACDHHPNTPSGLGLCGSLLNPLYKDKALNILMEAQLDHGLLCESFDKNTGDAKTGVGFATGAGYLAFALYEGFIKNETLKDKGTQDE